MSSTHDKRDERNTGRVTLRTSRCARASDHSSDQRGAELAVFMSSQVLQVTPHIVGLVVLMSSQVLQTTSYVVGLIALCTGT